MKAILFIYLITTFVHGQENVHGQMFFLVLRPNFFPAILPIIIMFGVVGSCHT